MPSSKGSYFCLRHTIHQRQILCISPANFGPDHPQQILDCSW